MKILVMGELCNDIFWYGNVDRLCPEGPVPIFTPENSIENAGMGGNVCSNLESLGVEYDFIHQPTTISKTRYISKRFNQIIIRIDDGDSDVSVIDAKVIENINFDDYGMVILSDYNKGFLTNDVIRYIGERAKNIILDTKKCLGDWCSDLTFIKLNRAEYHENLEWIEHNKWVIPKLIITLDKDGCLYQGDMYPVDEVSVKEITGAGDTFVAGFTYKYLTGCDVGGCIRFANKCSTQVVQDIGVTLINTDLLV